MNGHDIIFVLVHYDETGGTAPTRDLVIPTSTSKGEEEVEK